MKHSFIFILLLIGLVLLLRGVLAGIQKEVYATKECNCTCIPDPLPTDWLPEWFKLKLPPCKPKPTPTTPPPVLTPTPTLPPEATPMPTLPAGATPTPTTPPPGGGGSQPGGGGQGGPGGGPSCTDPAPNAPTLLSANKLGGGKVELKWTSVSPVTHYGVTYGPSSKNYLYGQTNIGNTTSYTVEDLVIGQNYCFVVNAVNNCASSPFSNEVCTGEVLGAAVLGLSATSGDTKPTEIAFFLIGMLCILSGLRLRTLKIA